MKILIHETKYKNPNDKSTTVTFRIIGERKENSTEIPIWEKSVHITKQEDTMYEKTALKKILVDNAIVVFNKFYQDNFQ